MHRIEGMVAAASAEHPDEELKQLLRSLVPDFHPHPTQPTPPDTDVKEIRFQSVSARTSRAWSVNTRCPRYV